MFTKSVGLLLLFYVLCVCVCFVNLLLFVDMFCCCCFKNVSRIFQSFPAQENAYVNLTNTYKSNGKLVNKILQLLET